MALFHVFSEVENRNTGVPMSGVQVRVRFAGVETLAPIYQDEAGTPFTPPNYCITDADGMYSFYVDSGEYDLDFLVGSQVIKTIPNYRPAEVGPSGPANSTYTTTNALENADVSNVSGILSESGKAGTFTIRNYTDFTSEVTADTGKVNYIRSISDPTKVWVRTTILPVGAAQTGAASGLTVDGELAAKATLTGVSRTATNLGTFTGSTIPDNVAIKAALQAVETAVENTTGNAATKANATAIGVAATDADMGTFTGTIIPDNQTAKQGMQALENSVRTGGLFIQTGTGAVQRTGQDKQRDVASVYDFDGTLATTISSTARTKPIVTDQSGLYLPGFNVVDPGRIFTTAMLPDPARGRAPIMVINNPAKADLLAGYASGLYVHIGDNPTATPGLGDTVAITTTVNNLNGRDNLWGSNTVAIQDASGTDGQVRSAEFEINNTFAFVSDPFGSGNRKNGIEIVGHGSSTAKVTAALTVWANGNTGVNWFDQGLVLSRVASKGLRFVRNPGGATDTGVAFSVAAISDESNSNATLAISGSHGSIIDLSGNPTYSQFILGKSNADTTFGVKNSANFGVGLSLDSGGSTAQASFIDFSDRGSPKWRWIKNNGNGFFLVADPLGTPVTVAEFASGGGGALGIQTSPAYPLHVNGASKLGGNVGFQGTNPIAKPTVTGAKGGNAALTSLLAALASYGLITDSTT